MRSAIAGSTGRLAAAGRLTAVGTAVAGPTGSLTARRCLCGVGLNESGHARMDCLKHVSLVASRVRDDDSDVDVFVVLFILDNANHVSGGSAVCLIDHEGRLDDAVDDRQHGLGLFGGEVRFERLIHLDGVQAANLAVANVFHDDDGIFVLGCVGLLTIRCNVNIASIVSSRHILSSF